MSEEKSPKRRAADKLRYLATLSEAQLFFGWLVVLFALALLGAIYLQQSSRIATLGRQVQSMQKELRVVKQANALLERDIAEGQTLERLESEAIRLGFQRAQSADLEYLTVNNFPVGADITLLPPPAPPPMPLETIGEALWRTLRNSVNDLQRGESP